MSSSGLDSGVNVWNMDLEPEQSLEGHQVGVPSADISPDSTTIACGDEGGLVKIWKVGVHEDSKGPLRWREHCEVQSQRQISRYVW